MNHYHRYRFLHPPRIRQKGKGSLSDDEWKYQYNKERVNESPGSQRFSEIDKSKIAQVSDMIRRGVRHPLKDKFKKYGDTFELVAKNESKRMYCYRRTTPEGIVYFEVFRSNLDKDEKGEVYESYPSSSQFGETAWCIRDSEHAQKKIQKYMNNYIPGRSASDDLPGH